MQYVLEDNFKRFPKCEKTDTLLYKEHEFPASVVNKIKNNSVKPKQIANIVCEMMDASIPLNKNIVQTAVKVFERDEDAFHNSFIKNAKDIGNISCYRILNKPNVLRNIEEIEEELTEKFKAKFRGRAPRIIHAIAVMTYLCKFDKDDVVDSFNMQKVKACMDKGILYPAEITVLMMGAKEIASPQIFESESARYALKSYFDYFKTGDTCYKNAADWISNHVDTNDKLLKKISKKANFLSIKEDTPVESIKTQLGNLSSMSEVEKIEKQYKKCKFKFRKCKFDLKFSDTVHDKYRMEILRPGDTRMVYLGEFTNCCQKLYDIGESAMMHGLLNPKAGFWCMTDERTGRVVAQAEIWEKENDDRTLVFDNIEFANDADIGLYKEAIGMWLKESHYENVYMGTGYNQMYNSGNFRTTEPLTPWVTPYEIYVISHEEESTAPIFNSEEEAKEALESGRVTYFDYVYCDSERNAVVMKENGRVEPYFSLEERTDMEDHEIEM